MAPERPNVDPAGRRDSGLRYVSRLTRLAVAGGVVATGAFAALAAHAFPGTSTQQATTPAGGSAATPSSTTTTPSGSGSSSSSVPGSGSSSSSVSGSTSSSNTQLQAPTTTVLPSTRHGHVTSGGS